MEWLFFLLPIAAISGWISARNHYKRRYTQQNRDFDPAYFKGLNYLLNEQPDKAIDVFIHLLEVNSETVETHLALANLFRRRGETERAIRIHQNLIARPNLSAEQRQHALLELGLDYMSAGVLDRAESLFLDLIDTPEPPAQAYTQLLRIYQQEKDWLKAIEMAKKGQSKQGEDLNPMIAQFYCELAEQSTLSTAETARFIKQAFHYDHDCVRATLLNAQLAIQAANYRKAIKSLLQIEQQNHHYIPEALALLLDCHQQTNTLANFDTWLREILSRYPNMTSVRLMLTHIIQLEQGAQAAQDYLYQQLHQHPSVEGLNTLISLGDTHNPILIPLITKITHNLMRRGHRYTCSKCGFAGHSLHWQCPSCQSWGNIKPTEIHLSSLETLLGHSS